MSSTTIRIPTATLERLKLLAEPFKDSPAKVILRLLDAHENAVECVECGPPELEESDG